MILVDTSIWIDHLHVAEPALVSHLADDEVGCHPYVIEELALGSLGRRDQVIELLGSLRSFPLLSHTEVLTLIERRRLWSRGLSAVDVHLLGAVLLVPGSCLWTRDKRLQAACRDAGAPASTSRDGVRPRESAVRGDGGAVLASTRTFGR